MGNILVISTDMGANTVESASASLNFAKNMWLKEKVQVQGFPGLCSRTIDSLDLQWSEAQLQFEEL